MNIYIDKENLKSYVKSASRSAFSDCNRMLKNQLNIKFTFSKKEIAQDNDIKEWTKTMNTGVNGNIDWEVSPPKRPLKPESIPSFTKAQLSSIYLLNNKYTDEIDHYGLIIYGGIGKEVDIINSLLMKDSDYGFMKQIPIKRLSHWKDLQNYLSPCSDIILIDKFIFSSEEINKYNIDTLLKTLCFKAKDAIINIVIFTLPYIVEKINDKTVKTKLNRNDYINYIDSIKKSVEGITRVEPNVTIIISSNLGEHDRQIFTNYKYIESGDSFNYFDSTWAVITKGRHIELFSLANRDFYDNGIDFVNDMQTLVDNVRRVNSDNIIGAQICNYLKFK